MLKNLLRILEQTPKILSKFCTDAIYARYFILNIRDTCSHSIPLFYGPKLRR